MEQYNVYTNNWPLFFRENLLKKGWVSAESHFLQGKCHLRNVTSRGQNTNPDGNCRFAPILGAVTEVTKTLLQN